MYKRITITFTLLLLLFSACSGQAGEPEILRLATTTSTENSGLLAAILPEFEADYNARVDVIAVGTGQALALGEAGDVDIILVHARSREDQFVADGYGTERFDVMYNDFVIVGPSDDPAGISDMALTADALSQIANSEASFASRGDDSGTNIKELSFWESAGVAPDASMDWYNSLGQGMGDTLLFAEETGSYTITDRGTFLAMHENLPNLVILVGGSSIFQNQDPALYNPYGVIPINPEISGSSDELAYKFVEWLTSLETQTAISQFGVEENGQPLFYPDSAEWHNQ
jgi:tungstate transport system substrate-binding protein